MKTKNNSPVWLKVTIVVRFKYQRVLLAVDEQDGNGLKLENAGPTFFQVAPLSLRKS